MKTKVVEKNKQIEESKVRSWGPNWSLVDKSVRSSMAIILLLFLAVLLWDFFGFSKPPRRTTNLNEESAFSLKPSPKAPFLFADEFQSGNWEIGEADWNFNLQQFPYRPTESELTALPEKPRSEDQMFDDSVFIELFEALSATKSRSQEMTIWRAKHGETDLVMLSSQVGDREIVQAIRACYPDAYGYSMMVGTPAGAVTEKSNRILLPLCEGATQLACRRSKNGIITSSIIDYSPKNVDIVEFWKQNDWNVYKASRNDELNHRYECHKNGIDVAATFITDEQGECKILLVRIPDVASPSSTKN